MKVESFTEYHIANLNDDDLKNIKELEQSINAKGNSDVVLIAYQQKEKAES